MHRIFVYGTLRRGMPNHELIASSCFLGPAATTERFRMIAESFPVLLSCRDGLAVAGELYEVDTQTLGRLDILSASARAAAAVMSVVQRTCTIGTAKSLLQAWLSYTSAIPAAGKRLIGRNGVSPIVSDTSNGREQPREPHGARRVPEWRRAACLRSERIVSAETRGLGRLRCE